MLEYHKNMQAELTIAVIEVPWEEASRFGILNTDSDGKIFEFEEKPKKPQNNLASMGIYIFNWELLKEYLHEDENDPHSSNDFGKDIIPKMINNGHRVYAYKFDGYWKDVGTVQSLWEANMDLLTAKPQLELHDRMAHLFQNPDQPPQYIAPEAKVNCSLINEGCVIQGQVQKSVLFPGVRVGPGSNINHSIIMSNVRIGANVQINNAIICEESIIRDDCQIGDANVNKTAITIVGDNLVVPNNTSIPGGTAVCQKNLKKFVVSNGEMAP